MRVSVLIPTRNRAALLREALRSAIEQTHQQVEIIVIDDGSEDDTHHVLAEHRHRVRTARQEKGGKSRALNCGMRLATGDGVLVLDDDDLLPPDAVGRHVAALRENPAATFSYGRFARFSGSPPAALSGPWSSADKEHVPIEDPRRTVIKLMEHCFLPHPTWMARREALERVGPYDVNRLRSQDFDMILRLARKDDGAFVDGMVLYQRQHAGPRPGVVASVGNHDAAEAWFQHDRQIFQHIATTWGVEEFRPYDDHPRPHNSRRACLLQKGAILFQRGCYDHALAALQDYCDATSGAPADDVERVIAGRLFTRQISPELLGDRGLGAHVCRTLRHLSWPDDIARRIVRGARWQIRAAILARNNPRAAAIARFLFTAFGPMPSLIGLASRHALPVQSIASKRSGSTISCAGSASSVRADGANFPPHLASLPRDRGNET